MAVNGEATGRGLRFRSVFILGVVVSLVVKIVEMNLLEGEEFLQLVCKAGSTVLLFLLLPCTILSWLWHRGNPDSPSYQQAITGFKWCFFLMTFLFMPTVLSLPAEMKVHANIGRCEALIPKLEEFQRREGRYPVSRRELAEKVTAAFHLPVRLSAGSYSLLVPLAKKSQRLSLDGPPAAWEFSDSMNSDRPSIRIPLGGLTGFPDRLASSVPSGRFIPFGSPLSGYEVE